MDKWHLIIDLSHPEGRSVNNGIDSSLTLLQYVCVNDIVQQLLRLGPGALMAKLDIKSAYRNVPVHPQDCLFLACSGKVWCTLILYCLLGLGQLLRFSMP